MKKKITIIGGGFSGTMTAVNLIRKSNAAFELILINERENLNKGTAYHPYSEKHLLNVIAGKMSAFPEEPNHFLDWVMGLDAFKNKDRTLIENAFLPRILYGEYLSDIWKNAVNEAESKGIQIDIIESHVVDIDVVENSIFLLLENGIGLTTDECVVATGNHLPRNPKITNMEFYSSPNYFQNPWKVESVINTQAHLPILIMGNGLTMVDTVFSLLEHGFKGTIISISPNGFNILPHRHNGLKYSKLVEEMTEDISIYELVKLINRHIKSVREFGLSAEPVIDSLRSHTQKIWANFSHQEKKVFMSRLRHLWGVARHRVPLHSHDKIQQLRIDGKLHINSGFIKNIIESKDEISVQYLDRKDKIMKEIIVSRVINCTGPETDFMKLEKSFLKNAIQKNLLFQDELKLGIRTDTNTFQILKPNLSVHPNLYTIGSNLRADLWESTAVNELRSQAHKLAERLKVTNQ